LRKHLVSRLLERAKEDARPFLVVGDLGYGVIEEFECQFPSRFINVGVAEQAGISFCAGLADKFLPFFYSIGNFPSFRALEQIRNDVAHEGWPVAIVSLGAGFSYGTAGYSHHAIEDAGAVASIIGMDVFTPSCVHELDHLLTLHWKNPRPMYLRLGSSETCSYEHPVFDSQYYSVYKTGDTSLALLVHGEIVHQVLEAVESIERNVAVFSAFHFNRLSEKLISELLTYERIATIEEHSSEGGFGMRARASLASAHGDKFLSLGVDTYNSHLGGSRAHLLEQNQLDSESIANRLLGFLDGR